MAVLSLLVPPVLSRYLSQAEFSAWMLILQLAAYTALLNLGFQSATSRYVAHYLARNDRNSASKIVSTAVFSLVFMAMLATVVIFAVGANIGRLFPALPASLVAASRTGLLIIGVALALGMPVEAIAGTLIGIQRNELVAGIQGGTRLVLAIVLTAIVALRGGVKSMAVAFATVSIAGYLCFWWVSKRLDVVDLSFRYANWESLRKIWAYCGILLVWTVAMFFINGFDVAIVGRLDFASVGVYSACFGPILLIAGAQQAIFSPLLQIGAARFSQGSEVSVPQLLLHSTKFSTLLLLSMSIPLLLFSRELIEWWLGPRYGNSAVVIFRLLLIGNTTRLLATPYAMLLLATLAHRRVILPPIIEAACNVLVAIAAGLRFGAIGVACGVVAGAFIGQLMIVYINAPRTMEVIGDVRAVLWRGVGQPIACFLPGVAAALLAVKKLPQPARSLIDLFALAACAALAWRFLIVADEKDWIRSMTSRRNLRKNHD